MIRRSSRLGEAAPTVPSVDETANTLDAAWAASRMGESTIGSRRTTAGARAGPHHGICREHRGFTPQTIRVEKFSIDEQGLGIEDLTGFAQELLDDPDSEPDEAERAERLKSIRAWIEHGCFVLYWENDLWLDGSGHVTSS